MNISVAQARTHRREDAADFTIGLHQAIGDALQRDAGVLHLNDDAARLVGFSTRQSEVRMARNGVVSAMTGTFTGRSVKDKYVVDDALTHERVWWDNSNSCTGAQFDLLLADMMGAAAGEEVFCQQLFAGADAGHRFDVEVYSSSAWHTLFIQHLLIQPEIADRASFAANVTILHLPEFKADPARHGVRSETAILLDFSRNLVLICGTGFAGEIKKSVFSLFNFHAPQRGVLPMHCSANVSRDGQTTLFFGLSGTGKTTLSTSADRALVGDDEHGWSDRGVFNLEDGCYAKAINLSATGEPEIFSAAKQFASVLENVIVDPVSGLPDYSDVSATENTRIAYPLSAIENRVPGGCAPTPNNVVLLAADAFGVLPPVARLTRSQAIYFFLSGYTAKLGGTERGVTEPQATFSACFGAPFMAQHPAVYGALLADRLARSNAQCWLINTGWSGGPYGVGARMKLGVTRRILEAALGGELDAVPFRRDATFGLDVPTRIEGVDANLLEPVTVWDDPAAYAVQAQKLMAMFVENFRKFGASGTALVGADPFKTAAQ